MTTVTIEDLWDQLLSETERIRECEKKIRRLGKQSTWKSQGECGVECPGEGMRSVQNHTTPVSTHDESTYRTGPAEYRQAMREMRDGCSSLVTRLEQAEPFLPREEFTRVGKRIERFIIDMAKSLDDFSEDRLLLVGEAFRVSALSRG